MKKLSLLLGWALLTGIASAAPYVVYSGAITGDSLTGTGAVNANTTVYVVTDVDDTAYFAVLLLNPSQKTYSVIGRPSDTPASDEANNNFLASVGSGRGAEAVLAYSIESTDSSSNTTVVRAYASGALSTTNTVLAAARRALTVDIKTNRVSSGTYTFNASSAVTTGGAPFAPALSGSTSGYLINSSGDLAHATTSGALSLSHNSTFTGLANIGGGYEVSAVTEIAVMPVSIASGQSESDAFVAWFSAFAQAIGYTPASSSSPAAASAYSGSIGTDGATLALNGSIDSGASLSIAGAGTLKVGGGNTLTTSFNAGQLTTVNIDDGSLAPGILVLGGVATGTTTGTGSSTPLNLNLSSTCTITLVDTGTLSLGGGLTITGGSGAIGNGGGELTLLLSVASGATFTATTGTFTVSSVTNGLVAGTLTVPSITPQASGYLPLTSTTIVVNGSTGPSSIVPGTVITGSISLSGGAEDMMAYTSGTLTVTGGTLTSGSFTPTDLPSPGQSGTFTGPLLVTGGFTITAVNNDGTYNGTLDGGSPVVTYPITEANLSPSQNPPYTVNDTLHGSIEVFGGTVSNTSGTITFSGGEVVGPSPSPGGG